MNTILKQYDLAALFAMCLTPTELSEEPQLQHCHKSECYADVSIKFSRISDFSKHNKYITSGGFYVSCERNRRHNKGLLQIGRGIISIVTDTDPHIGLDKGKEKRHG